MPVLGSSGCEQHLCLTVFMPIYLTLQVVSDCTLPCFKLLMMPVLGSLGCEQLLCLAMF